MKQELKINSKEYWDCRFDTDWETKSGREQTSYFTNLAIRFFPESLKEIINKNSRSILDCGCAEGDGTHQLANEFRTSKVAGLDFSQCAINKARKNYPDDLFICGTLKEHNEKYDVIYSSNCLEHFESPMEALGELMEYANHFLVLLVPFQEFNRIDEHFSTFDYTSFNLVINDFMLIFHVEIDTSVDEPTYWPGKQMLLVYISKKSNFIHDINLNFYENVEKEKNEALKELKSRLNKRDLNVESLTNQLDQKDEELRQKNKELGQKNVELRQIAEELGKKDEELGQKNVELRQIAEELGQKNVELRQIAEELGEKDEELGQKSEEFSKIYKDLVQRDQEIVNLKTEVSYKNSQIEMIYSTRTYRLATKIWKTKQFLLTSGAKYLPKPIKTIIKTFYQPYIQPENTVNPHFPNSTDYLDLSISKYDVLCFPVIDWGLRFQRPQQLIRQFAQNGYRAFYFTTYFNVMDSNNLNTSKLYNINQIEDNVFEVTLVSCSKINLYKDKLDQKNLQVIKDGIYQLKHDFGISVAICLVDLPFWNPVTTVLKEEQDWKILYDCMDQHKGFSTNDDAMLSEETELSKNADLVVVTAQKLYEEQRKYNPNCKIIPNAADFEHFNGLKENDLLNGIKKPIVGYYGAISDWFDVDLALFLAQKRPEYSFVLIGSTFGADVGRLEKLNNVYLLGEKPYQELPLYLYWFDVCIIPFKLNILTEATNPVKFFEYISAGKPVVSVQLPELIPYTEFLYLADNREAFLQNIDFALNEDISIKNSRIELARQNNWKERFKLLSQSIERLYPSVSIVIVTFNNLYLTKLCIDSIFTKSCYANFEIVLIDNNSDDGTREYLQKLVAEHDNVKIVLNKDNAGFAKANNQGIKVSKGDYIILLNNDIVVTHGWISRLLKYLRDPFIGMVGPVTNSCGNEAKIDVAYKEITDMDRFAMDYMNSHEGNFFEIKMLAMYCVAFRRKLIDEIGMLDERFGIGMFEDDDYSERIKAKGYKIICAEDVFIHHFGRASFQKIPQEEYLKLFEDNKKKFENKWDQDWQPHKYRD